MTALIILIVATFIVIILYSDRAEIERLQSELAKAREDADILAAQKWRLAQQNQALSKRLGERR